MKSHFQQTNRSKYSHKERQPFTKHIKKKRFGSITDLKKTGASERAFKTQPQTKFRSKYGEGVVFGYNRYKWPFNKSGRSRDNTKPGAVSVKQMNAEVTAWTPIQIRKTADVFAKSWAAKYEVAYKKAPRKKRKIGPEN